MKTQVVLKKLKTSKPKKQKYSIILQLSHGDADHHEDFTIDCISEKHFIQLMNDLETEPPHPSGGGDDVVYQGMPCQIDSFEGRYFDENGEKWVASVK